MANEIYPQSVFENQTNGSVFYKEGKLNDPMMPAKAGIFESWKYSFDSGKQVFKATDSDKVYEKRIIKDKFGNPHWSEWMEISPGEAHGIQAIAINDRPLLLPNTDGAIKLQITPQMIDTFTKREIYDLVESKIHDEKFNGYIYVHWVEGCNNAKEVLEATYPNGGKTGEFYLVEPQTGLDGEEDTADVFIWDKVDADNENSGYAWIPATIPDMKAFVAYPIFDDHRFDKTSHTSKEDRERWDETAAIANKATEDVEDLDRRFNEHINDIGELSSPHISVEERQRLNEVFQNVKRMPSDTLRHVVENGGYTIAYEQTQQASEATTITFKRIGQSAHKDGDILISREDGLRTELNRLTSENNVIESVYIEIQNVSIFGDYNWWIEADNGFVSKVFTKEDHSYDKIQIPFNQIPEVFTFRVNNKDANVSFNSFALNITYKAILGVDIGDSSKQLALNLVGPEGAVPTYNGIPLTDLTPDSAETAKWGKITGDINLQTDLDKKIAKAISSKINHGDLNSYLRFDVYRDGVIKSVIQQPNTEQSEISVKIEADNGPYRKGSVLINNIRNKVRELKDQGYVIYSSKFIVENISVYQNEDSQPLPVYFRTDNNSIPDSPIVAGGFEWDWPGDLFNDYNQIILVGNDAEYITNARLEIKCIKYGDVEIGLYDDLNSKFYNITIKADELAERVNNFIVAAVNNFEIRAGNNGTISAEKTLSIGGKNYEYGAEKLDANSENDNVVLIYGQEADSRYAGKDNFDALSERVTTAEENIDDLSERLNETNDSIETLETEIDDRIDSVETDLNTKITDLSTNLSVEASKLEELRNELEAKFNEENEGDDTSKAELLAQIEELNNRINTLNDNIALEEETRRNADDALNTSIEDTKAHAANIDLELNNVKETYVTKEELSHLMSDDLEGYDLIINDSEEFTQSIIDGTFVNAERILFKKGNYSFDTEDRNFIDNPIDFSNIKLVKGEYPTEVKICNNGQALPINTEDTRFEDINFSVGFGSNIFEIDDGNRVLSLSVSGQANIKLNPNFGVYKLSIIDDSIIRFENGANDKQYVIYIDQGNEVHKVSFSNYFENGNDELVNGLENQVANRRTLLKIHSDNAAADNGFILEEVIYGLINAPTSNNVLEVVVNDDKCNLYNSATIVKAADLNASNILVNPGNKLSLSPIILPGFAHADDGRDYSVSIEDGRTLGYGKCDETTTFDIPFGIKPKADGTMPKIYVDFTVKPQLARIKLDPTFKNYVKNGSKLGFTVVQTYYGETNIQFEMKDDFYAFGYESDDGLTVARYQGSLPWKFIPKARDTHEDYDIIIKPNFYAKFDNFTMSVVSSYPFDKTKVALAGTNRFMINGAVSEAVLNDPNYGVLYTQAPISFVEATDEETGDILNVSGEVYFSINKKSQEADITFNEDSIGKNVLLNLSVAGDEGTTYVRKFYIGNINGTDGEIKFGDGTEIEKLDTIVNEGREFTIQAKYSSKMNDYTGTWTSSNNNIISISESHASPENGSNIAKIKALAKGKATLTFKNNFTGLTTSLEISVVTHAKTMQCMNTIASAESVITPIVKYFDFNDREISSNLVSNSNFIYTNPDNSEFLNVEDSTNIKLTNARFPVGTTRVTVTYSVQPEDDVPVVEDGSITITPAEYSINYTISRESKILGHTLYGAETGTSIAGYNCFAKGGQLLNFIITLEDGVSLSEENIRTISNSFDNFELVYSKQGKFSAMIKMPYHNVSFEL